MNQNEKLFSTFYLEDRMYGIEVTQVQEVTRRQKITPVRLAPIWVRGLVNLRGQIATAVGLRELFGLEYSNKLENEMAIVCKIDTDLISLQVDKVGDVISVSNVDYEPTPDIVDNRISTFLNGVYKISGSILSVIDINNISRMLNATSSQ
jgi:purine-binding chemotaxis protein CheW